MIVMSEKTRQDPIDEFIEQRQGVVIAAVLVVAAVLRLYRLGVPSLWLDEAHSIWIALKPAGEIVRYVNIYEIHPHLFYLFLHFWMKIFGSGEFFARLPFALFNVAEVYFVFLLGREVFNRKVALFASVLIAFSNFEILFAQEVRMYTMLLLAVTMAYYYYVKSLKTGKNIYWAYFAAASLFGVYTDYRFGLVLISCFVFFFLYSGAIKNALKKMLVTFGAIALASAPLIPVFINQSGPRGGGTSMKLFLPDLTPTLVAKTFFSYLGGYILPVHDVVVWISVIASLGLIVYGVVQWIKAKKTIALILPLTLVISYVLVILYSVFRAKIFSIHNMMFLSPLFLIMLVGSAMEAGKRWKPALGAVAVVLLALNIYAGCLWYFNPEYTKQNFKNVVRFITPRMQPNDAVVLTPHYQHFTFDYYYKGKNPVIYLKPGMLNNPRIEAVLNHSERVWWIFAADRFIDPGQSIRKHVSNEYKIIMAFEARNMHYHPVIGRSIQVYLGVKKDGSMPKPGDNKAPHSDAPGQDKDQ